MIALGWGLAAAAFAVELALVAGAGIVGWRAAGFVGAVLGVLAIGAVWALLMSPNADHRLPHLLRYLAAGLLLAGVGRAWGGDRGLLLGLAGWPTYVVADLVLLAHPLDAWAPAAHDISSCREVTSDHCPRRRAPNTLASPATPTDGGHDDGDGRLLL